MGKDRQFTAMLLSLLLGMLLLAAPEVRAGWEQPGTLHKSRSSVSESGVCQTDEISYLTHPGMHSLKVHPGIAQRQSGSVGVRQGVKSLTAFRLRAFRVFLEQIAEYGLAAVRLSGTFLRNHALEFLRIVQRTDGKKWGYYALFQVCYD